MSENQGTTNATATTTATAGAEGTSAMAGAAGTTTAAAGATQSKLWYEALNDADLKTNASLRRFGEVEALAKSYVHLEKTLNAKNTVAIPDQHATDDDYKAVFQKLGLPGSLDKYELKREGYDPAFLGEFKKLAHEANILPKQAQKLADWYASKQKATMEEQTKAASLAVSQAVEGLKKEYGKAFEPTLAKAKAAVTHYGSKEFVDFLNTKEVDGMKLTDHPAMFKFMAKISETLKEGQFKGESYYQNAMTPAQAMTKAKTIIADPSHPYRNKSHPNHMAAVKEVQELFAMAE